MPDGYLVAVGVGTVAAFLLGGVYYALLGGQLAQARGAASDGRMPPWKLVAELIRCLILAAALGCLAAWTGVEGVGEGLFLGSILWFGFPFVLWTGAVVHEGTPLKLAAIHAGDWLLKLLVLSVIVTVLQ